LFLGVLGLLTGMLWAKYTWGEAWSNDPKQNSAAIGMLVYLAYFVLRGSLDEAQKRAKIAAVYSVFAFPVMIVLLFILPRLTDSLHPGNGGNPGFNKYDMDNQMRMVFYPAVIGWILIGVWVMQIRVRLLEITNQILEN
jgi:heme exporter protein C